VQKILGHYSILTTARYTHLTSHTNASAKTRIDALMQGFTIAWGTIR
jgi:integrase